MIIENKCKYNNCLPYILTADINCLVLCITDEKLCGRGLQSIGGHRDHRDNCRDNRLCH